MQHGLRGWRPDERFKQGRGMADDRNRATFSVRRHDITLIDSGKKIASRHVLRRKNQVHRLQRELPPVVQKIRQMRLPEPGLARQQ